MFNLEVLLHSPHAIVVHRTRPLEHPHVLQSKLNVSPSLYVLSPTVHMDTGSVVVVVGWRTIRVPPTNKQISKERRRRRHSRYSFASI